MAVDTPATVAVLGAGPIGLEAALYARFLGYDVAVYEQGQVGEHFRRFAHVRLFSPWRMNVSPLGLAAIKSQNDQWRPADDDALLTAGEHVERYLDPLAATDLLADHLRLGTRVVAVGKQSYRKGDLTGQEERGFDPFRILLRDANGRETIETADVVIDATGTYATPCCLGRGGVPAVGELELQAAFEYHLPDVLGKDRWRYAGRRTLVVGRGYSAATTVTALAELARDAQDTHVTWLTSAPAGELPLKRFEDDRLAARDQLSARANALAGGAQAVRYLPESHVESVEHAGAGGFSVRTGGGHEEQLEVDELVANVGYRPDNSLFRELRVHQCYASAGPMKLAAALMAAAGSAQGDCLDQQSAGPQSLLTTEPNFYVLGQKSYGRNPSFLLGIGLAQVRDLFTIIGDREDLDLFRSIGGRSL